MASPPTRFRRAYRSPYSARLGLQRRWTLVVGLIGFFLSVALLAVAQFSSVSSTTTPSPLPSVPPPPPPSPLPSTPTDPPAQPGVQPLPPAAAADPSQQPQPSLSRCQSVIQPLINNPCMSQLGSGFAEMDNAEVEDQYLNVMANVVQTLCSDVCSAVFTSSAKAIVDNCWAELSIVVGRPLMPNTSRQDYEAQKAASLESILFSRDLMCNRNPNVQSQLCALNAIELDRKHKITSGGFFIEDEEEEEEESDDATAESIAVLDQPSSSQANASSDSRPFVPDEDLYNYDPESESAADPNSPTAQKYRLLGVLYGVELAPSLITLPEVNMSAWSRMPRAEACTACLSMQLEQSSTFIATRAKTANKGKHLSPEMQNVCRRVTQIVSAVNGKCGQEWVRTPTDLVALGLGSGAGGAGNAGGRVQGNGLVDNDGFGFSSSATAMGISPVAWIVSFVVVGVGLTGEP